MESYLIVESNSNKNNFVGNKMRIDITQHTKEIENEIVPIIKFKIYIKNTNISSYEKNVHLLVATPKLTLNGRYVTSSDSIIVGEPFGEDVHRELEIEFPFPRNTIDAIESQRIDDLPLNLSLQLLYSYQDDDSNIHYEKTYVNLDLKYSQREWTEILQKMGYTESWIFEITRAKIEGLDTVVEHLQKAADCYYIRDYDNCMANSRIAWDDFKPLLDSKWKQIAIMIDEGSEGQTNHDPKSKRIKEIIDKIHYLSNVGIHRERYKVFPEDAMLCYYLTVSMISYLSRWLNKVRVE